MFHKIATLPYIKDWFHWFQYSNSMFQIGLFRSILYCLYTTISSPFQVRLSFLSSSAHKTLLNTQSFLIFSMLGNLSSMFQETGAWRRLFTPFQTYAFCASRKIHSGHSLFKKNRRTRIPLSATCFIVLENPNFDRPQKFLKEKYNYQIVPVKLFRAFQYLLASHLPPTFRLIFVISK